MVDDSLTIMGVELQGHGPVGVFMGRAGLKHMSAWPDFKKVSLGPS